MNVDIVVQHGRVIPADWSKKKRKIPRWLLTSVERKWQSVQCYQKATETKVFLDNKYFNPIKKKEKRKHDAR